MGEIKVQVTPNKPQSLQIGTKNVKTPIQIEENPTHYYSTLAKQWAVKTDGMVQDEDFSSKYWAQESKNQAKKSAAAAESATNLVDLLDNKYTNYVNNLEELSSETVSEITELKLNSLEEIEQKHVNAIEDITLSKTVAIDKLNDVNINIQNEIFQSKTDAVNAVQNEGAAQIANIQQTGFYMRDGNLYYIDENGQEQEFKSGNNALTQNQISNCVIEVPQTIKVEIAAGKPTLKAGSTIIIPDGYEEDGTTKKFIYKTIEADIFLDHVTSHTSGLLSVQWVGTGSEPISPKIDIFPHTLIYSQATQPTSIAYWYDTTNNYCYGIGSSGTITQRAALPFASFIGGGASIGITSLDCIFNGVGFMGSITWVDKGVRCLFADERNPDGTLKSKDVTQSILTMTSLSNQSSQLGRLSLNSAGALEFNGWGAPYYFESGEIPNINSPVLWYNTDANRVYYGSNSSNLRPLFTIVFPSLIKLSDTANITSMSTIHPFNLAQNSSTGARIVRTHYQDTSGYTIYSNGYCEQWGRVTTNDGSVPVTLLLPMADINYNIGQSEIGTGGADPYVNGYRFVDLTTTGFTLQARNNGLKTCCWSIKGRMA